MEYKMLLEKLLLLVLIAVTILFLIHKLWNAKIDGAVLVVIFLSFLIALYFRKSKR